MTKKNRILCLLIACVLMLSVFSFCAFAEGDETDGLLLGASGETTAATTAPADTTAATTAPADTTATTATTASTVAKTWLEKNEGLVITLGVIAALVIVFFILWFASSKFKDKVKKFAKDYKSEFKKLVWPTKQSFGKILSSSFFHYRYRSVPRCSRYRSYGRYPRASRLSPSDYLI